MTEWETAYDVSCPNCGCDYSNISNLNPVGDLLTCPNCRKKFKCKWQKTARTYVYYDDGSEKVIYADEEDDEEGDW